MADVLGMDPGRIERLRSAERLTYLDPERVWDAVAPVEAGTIVDIHAHDIYRYHNFLTGSTG